MNETLAKLFRTLFVAGIAFIGMIMAAILVVSTAVAVGIVYIVAKLRGKPFAARSWSNMSQARWGFQQATETAHAGSAPAAASNSGFASRTKRADVMDVEVRDLP